MAHKLLIADEKLWRKDCDVIDRKQLAKIFEAIRKLEKDPWDGNIQVRQLKHYELADCRLRIEQYRVLFNKFDESKEVHLLRVLHRSKLY